MIPTVTVALWGSEIETSGEHYHLSMPSLFSDANGYCCPSLGLGNAAGAEILEGDVWGAPKSQKHVAQV